MKNTDALRALLVQRQNGPFVSSEEMGLRLEALIAVKKRKYLGRSTARRP